MLQEYLEQMIALRASLEVPNLDQPDGQQLKTQLLPTAVHVWPSTFRFRSNEELVLKYGRTYEYRGTPYHPVPRGCFHSAYRHATKRRSPWIYVEGYAVKPYLPLVVQHAWLARADQPGGAFELAWDCQDGLYIGIPFKIDYVRKVHVAGKRRWYSVLDAWWLNYPLLRGETAIEDVIDSR